MFENIPILIAYAWAAAAAGQDPYELPEDVAAHLVWRVSGGASGCQFSPDGRRLLVYGERGVHVLDAGTGERLLGPLGQPQRTYVACFSPDGRRILTGGTDDAAHLWDATTGEPVTDRLDPKGTVNAASFSPNGRRLVTGSQDHSIRLWEVATGRMLLAIQRNSPIRWVQFGPDGDRVYANDGSVCAFDATTGERLVGPLAARGATCAALSGDGTRLATAGYADGPGHVGQVWDVGTGKMIAQTAGHWGSVRTVAFSRDGTRLATSTDGSVRVWDAATGAPLTKPLGDKVSMMHFAVFSPDGRYVLGGGEGGRAGVWDAATGKLILEILGCDAFLGGAFSPDGKTVATSGIRMGKVDHDEVFVWRVPHE